MGGDNAPEATIKGAVKAIKEVGENTEILLTGNEEIINSKVKTQYEKYHQK